jgi:MoaA/NifB/PqqE/SkfB family radical SAM enzyme
MTLALALRLIDLPSIERVCFGQYGEPLLWPYLSRAVLYASTRSHYTWLTTNGQLLEEHMIGKLLDAGISKIIISIDALDPITYEKLRPGLEFNRVMRNLQTLVRLRAERDTPEIVVNLVRSQENEESSDGDVRAFFLAHGVDGVAITPEIDVSPPKESNASGDPINCERPYRHLTVHASGELMLCCRDCHSVAGPLGSVLPDPLAAYNGEAMTAIRRALETGEGMPSICRGCRAHWPDCRKPIRAGDEK